MHWFIFGLIIIFNIQVFGKVLLKKGVKKTVQCDGNDLILHVTNHEPDSETLKICFGSFNKESKDCLLGFALLYLTMHTNPKRTVLKLNRQGTFDQSGKKVENIRFNNDNLLDVMLFDASENVEVLLENAVVLEKHGETKTGVSKWWIGLIIGFILLVLLVLLIGFAIWFFFWRKKPVRVTVAQRTIEKTVEKTESVQCPPPEPIIVEAKPNEKTTMTKRTSSSTTKASDEKVGLKQAVAKPRVSRSVSKETKSASIETPAPTKKSEKTLKSKKMLLSGLYILRELFVYFLENI